MVRFKNRYLIGQLVWKDGIAAEGLSEAIILTALRDSLEGNGGDLAVGTALWSLQVKYYNSYSHVLVLRCDRSFMEQVLQAAVNLNVIQLRRVTLDIQNVAGTIKACQRHALSMDAAALQERSARLPATHMAAAIAQQRKLTAIEN